MKSNWKNWLFWIGISIFLVFYALIIKKFYLSPFYDWDEAIYAYLASKNQFPGWHLFYNQQLWLEKPVLLFLFWQLLAQLASINFILRVQNIIPLLFIFYFSFKLINKNINEKIPQLLAYFAFAFLLLSSNIFSERIMILNTDIYLACAILGMIYFRQNSKLTTLFLVLAVAAKSLLGFFVYIFILFFDNIKFWLKNQKINTNPKYWLTRFFQCLLALHWHILMFFTQRTLFVREHLQDHLFSRVNKAIELHFGGRMYYAWEYFNSFSQLSKIILIIVTLMSLYYLWKIRHNKKTLKKIFSHDLLILMIFTFLYALFLTITQTKIIWYLYPIIVTGTLSLVILFTQLCLRYPRKLQLILLFVIVFLYICQIFKIYQNTKIDSLGDLPSISSCINQNISNYRIDFLVATQERQNAQVLEASNLIISTSLRYGGSPRLLLLTNAPYRLIYKTENLNQLKDIQYLLFAKSDQYLVEEKLQPLRLKTLCQSQHYTFGQINP